MGRVHDTAPQAAPAVVAPAATLRTPAAVPDARRKNVPRYVDHGGVREKWERLSVMGKSMDDAAKRVTSITSADPQHSNVFIGLHAKFFKVYDANGDPLGPELPLKDDVKIVPKIGIYELVKGEFVALTASTLHPDQVRRDQAARGNAGSPLFRKEDQAKNSPDGRKAAAGRPAPNKAKPQSHVWIGDLVAEPDRFRALIGSGHHVYCFAPRYEAADSTSDSKGGAGASSPYSSPIEGREDGTPPNAPPWPVSLEGPKLVPTGSDPTYKAKIDWMANGNYALAPQIISRLGENFHYRWELFDITAYVKKETARNPTGGPGKPGKTLAENIEAFKKSKSGSGTDVTGMGGAKREFAREFDDWWEDTKRAADGYVNAHGDTVGERLSNTAANLTALTLAPVSLLMTDFSAELHLIADLFAGPRQQQEIPLMRQGYFLVRVITTPAVNKDRNGNDVVRPPSVDAKVVEVMPMGQAVRESLDEPAYQLAVLRSQIDIAEAQGNTAKAEYLQSLLKEARADFLGSPLDLLKKRREKKWEELEQFFKDHPKRPDYSIHREIATLDAQIARYESHDKKRTEGATGLPAMTRVNATLISEVTGEQYPLLLAAGPMAKAEDGRYRWMISDVTSPDAITYTGLGNTPSDAFHKALKEFGGKAAYGRGQIGVRTLGLGLEPGARPEFIVDSAPADWALAEKRIDDLVAALTMLGLVVASAGTAAMAIGGVVAAARIIKRWRDGNLALDGQTFSDLLSILGTITAAGQLAAGLKLQKLGPAFVIAEEGQVTAAELARVSAVLKAQTLAKAVEAANKAMNYAGLIWGEVTFIDQMMSISQQEDSGAMTHAAARRARAGAVSSAVQNHVIFIAGILKEHAEQAKAAEHEHPVGERAEDHNGETVVPRTAQPVPLSERQATKTELQEALPPDLRHLFLIDDSLPGDTVQVEPTRDPATPWLITDITVRCGPDARPATVALHTETVRTMQRYQGFSARVWRVLAWIADRFHMDRLNPENATRFAAQGEIQKLPRLIEKQVERMRLMEPNARDEAEAELDSMKQKLESSVAVVTNFEETGGPGFVAAPGVAKAKQKAYAKLSAERRKYRPGDSKHKEIRYEMYKMTGGDWSPERWGEAYDNNMRNPNKANAIVATEFQRLGWGEAERTIEDLGDGEVRRLDIATASNITKRKRGIEIKAYESGLVTATDKNKSEVERDARLVKEHGWQITWIIIDCDVSAPLLRLLYEAGITVEYRITTGPETEFHSRVLPRRK